MIDVSAAASGWIPGLEWRAGTNAYYRAGRIAARLGVAHFTVGTNSTPIGDRGYFTFLIPKLGPPQQFAEWDAVTWHACEWNIVAWGIEFERLSWDEPLTDSQVAWGGYLVAWLYALAPSVPLTLQSAPRLAVGSDYTGYANHDGLHESACDEHYDGVTDDEWHAILVAGGLISPPAPRRGRSNDVIGYRENIPAGGQRFWIESGARLIEWTSDEWYKLVLNADKTERIPTIDVTTDKMTALHAAYAGSGSGGGGTDTVEVKVTAQVLP